MNHGDCISVDQRKRKRMRFMTADVSCRKGTTRKLKSRARGALMYSKKSSETLPEKTAQVTNCVEYFDSEVSPESPDVFIL